MMKDTTGNKVRARQWLSWGLATLTVLTGLALLYGLPALRYSSLTFDREEIRDRTDEVRERAEKIRERQKQERQQRKLTRPHARELTRKLEKKHRREIRNNLEKLIRHHRELESIRRERLEALDQQSLPDRLSRQLSPLIRAMEQTVDMMDQLKRFSAASVNQDKIPQPYTYPYAPPLDWFRETAEILRRGFDPAAVREVIPQSEQIMNTGYPDEATAERMHFVILNRRAQEYARKAKQEAEKLLALAESAPPDQYPPTLTESDPPISDEIAVAGEIADHPEPDLPASVQKALNETGEPSVADLYEAMQAMEQTFNQTLDQTRAVELAIQTGSSPEDAAGKLLPTSSRLESIPSLRHPEVPGTIAELNDRREGAAQAARNAEQMLAQAARSTAQMAGQATGRSSTLTTGIAMGQALQSQLEQAARQSNARGFGDVSGLMRMALGASGGSGQGDPGEDRNRNDSLNTSNRVTATPAHRPLTDPAANALPGRRFSRSSPRSGWLYLDTWYIIGPWENEGDLSTFSTIHPPEAEINFDASYPGKVYSAASAERDREAGIKRGYTIGQPRNLKWKFHQSDTIRVVVPDEASDATYYLYTDVYFEEARDMLIAVGSDDAAKVWINGMVAWQDENQSSWRLGEDYRKVYFKQGYNDILVRLENGPSLCELSLLLVPTEE
jgi:hypothetical protein